MRNVWIFARKEFLLNVRSSRFVVGLLLCLVIVLFTMIVSVSDYQIQKEVCEAEVTKVRTAPVFDHTNLLTIKVPNDKIMKARFYRGENGQ